MNILLGIPVTNSLYSGIMIKYARKGVNESWFIGLCKSPFTGRCPSNYLLTHPVELKDLRARGALALATVLN